MDIALKSFEWN